MSVTVFGYIIGISLVPLRISSCHIIKELQLCLKMLAESSSVDVHVISPHIFVRYWVCLKNRSIYRDETETILQSKS